QNSPRDFAAGRARKFDRHRQTRFFEPEIEMLQPASLDLDDDLIGRGLRFRQIAQFEFSRRAMGDKLDGFHAGILTQETGRGKAATNEARHSYDSGFKKSKERGIHAASRSKFL